MNCEPSCVYGDCVNNLCQCKSGYGGIDCGQPFEYILGTPYNVLNYTSVALHILLLGYLIYVVISLHRTAHDLTKRVVIYLITFAISRKLWSLRVLML